MGDQPGASAAAVPLGPTAQHLPPTDDQSDQQLSNQPGVSSHDPGFRQAPEDKQWHSWPKKPESRPNSLPHRWGSDPIIQRKN